MKNLAQANLSCPLLLVGASLASVLDFCQQVLSVDNRTRQLFISGVHPDFCQIEPDLEQIRNLNLFVNSKPQMSPKKIILMDHAENLNEYAANALLKNLEEPGVDVLFILLAKHANLLPATIVSRCQVMQMQSSVEVEHETIGQMTQDLQDLWSAKSTTSLQIVEKWSKQWPTDVLYWFELTLSELIKQCYLGHAKPAVQMSKLWAMLEQVKQVTAWRAKKMQPNLQLTLESIFLV